MHAHVLAVVVQFAAVFTGTALGLTVPQTHVSHEKRHVPHSRINKRMAPNAVLPMRIGLRQNSDALQSAEDWLMEVSRPDSPRYGQHWSSDAIIAAFSPSDETVDTVANWLIDAGISKERLTHSGNKAWLAFDATVEEAEKLLHTEYFHDGIDGEHGSAVGCNEYHLPKHVQSHVDYVTPGLKTTMMDLRPASAKKRSPKSKRSGNKKPSSRRRPQSLKFKAKPEEASKSTNTTSELANCDELITPACIRALYHFDAPSPNATVSANNSLGIFEESDYYAQEDFDLFFSKYTPYIANGTHPILDSVDGGEAPVDTSDAGGESDLDFELAYPM